MSSPQLKLPRHSVRRGARPERPKHAAPRAAGPGRVSRRATAVMGAGLPVIALVLAGALAVLSLAGHGPRSGRLTANQGPAGATAGSRLALVALPVYPGQQQRGVFQTFSHVVASGETVVAIGSQTSDGLTRQEFIVSANGGASWHLAPVRTPGAGQPPLGYLATRAAGGPGGWVAVGPRAIWTSQDGLSWTLAARHGISPRRPGDTVWVLTKTADGFVAAGTAADPSSGGGAGRGATRAVIWTSRNGVSWQRLTAAKLGPGQTVTGIFYAAAYGDDTVIAGTVTSSGQSFSGTWLSTDGGTAWTRVTIPAGHGAAPAISGLAFDAAGLVAVRPAAGGGGVSYFSPNGRTWQYSATIRAAAGWTPSVVKGSDAGLVVTGTTAAGQVIAYTSTGAAASWRLAGMLGSAAAESVVSVTVAPGGTVIAVGSAPASPVGQQPVFLEVGPAGEVRPVSLAGSA